MKKVSILFILLMLVNCTYNWGNFKEYSVEAPDNLEVVGSGTVKGEDCGVMFFFNTWYNQSLAQATRNALAKAPGATGLKDVVVTGKHYDAVIFACILVEGTPVKEKSGGAAPAAPAKGKK